jgi:hypothetical protein
MKTITKYLNNRVWLCAALLVVSVSACQTAPPQATTAATAAIATSAPTDTPTSQPTLTPPPIPFELTSPAFENGGVIPKGFSCEGSLPSPELNWGDPPAGTQSFALIFNDPTLRPGWVHWIVYGLPADYRGLLEGFDNGGEGSTEGGIYTGLNSWNLSIYRGPCPPTGSTHTYVFTLYALDTMLESGTRLNKEGLQAAMEGHILAQVDLSATFTR